MSAPAPVDAASIALASFCEFCDHAHILEVAGDARRMPPCPKCGATIADRCLAALLMAHLSLDGNVLVPRFLAEKTRRGLVIGSLGMPFSDAGLVGDLIDFPLRATTRSLVSMRRRKDRALRLPFKDASLDVLLLGGAGGVSLGFAELRRVVRAGGMVVVAQGLRWPLPETSVIGTPEECLGPEGGAVIGSDIRALARDAELLAHFDRPAAGFDVLQRHALLVMYAAL